MKRQLSLLVWLAIASCTAAVVDLSETEMEMATRALTHDENKKMVHTLLGHHHVVETHEEHRQYELDMTLKTGKFQIEKPDSSPVTHHDLFKEESVRSGGKKAKKSTNKLMEDYLASDGDGEITAQGTGQSDLLPVASPVVAPPAVSPVSPPANEVASKTSVPSSTSSPTTESKGKGKKKKKGKDKDSDSEDSEDEDAEDVESEETTPSKEPKGDKKDSVSVVAPSMAPLSFDLSFAPTPTIQTNTTNTVLKRTLSAAAFEYVLTTDAIPTEADLDELLNITDTLFKQMFVAFFESRPEAGFQNVEVSQLIAHRRNFIEFIVDLFFEDTGAVPELAQLEEVARQQLGSGAEYRDVYLSLLRTTTIYGTATLFLYVSDRDELTALIALVEPGVATNTTVNATEVEPAVRDINVGAPGDDESENGSNVTRIVSPLAAFAGILVVVGALVQVRRNRNSSGLDRNENLMKHTRDDFVEVGTVSGNTYRTNAFSDDGTLSVANGYDGYKPAKDVTRSPRVDMDDVSLGDDARSTNSVASATHSRSNSNDSDEGSVGTMIKSVRETMTADAFKPKKSVAYNQHIKPAWAARGYSSIATQIDVPDESYEAVEEEEVSEGEEGNTLELEEETSVFFGQSVSEFVKQELSLPELLETDERSTSTMTPLPESVEAVASELAPSDSTPTMSDQETEAEKRTEDEILSSVTSKIAAVEAEPKVETNDTRPAWMKTQLKPVDSSSPKWSPTPSQSAPPSAEPEWMQKFKQMGLDKNS